MTPTPKAEEVADACVRLCEANDGTSACEKCVVQALTAYADARVKEDLETKCFCAVKRSYYSLRCKGCHGIIRTYWEPEERLREARAEALEEAANVCDAKIQDEIEFAKHVKGQAVFQGQAAIDAVSDVAEIIRALKGEATRCTCDIPGKPHSADCPSWKEPS